MKAREPKNSSVVVLLSLAAMRMREDGLSLREALALLRRVWNAGRK
jgi:hypothetical protein